MTIRPATFTSIETDSSSVKWDLDSKMPMKGAATRRILDLIAEVESEGLL